ncbi:unnamed protein product [Clonostachys rhizophaga]|uniref:Uncharacterized protein n=1 Tax=Clonostachys rhizophaga TaxID=160324 RepID=A0A9N9YSU6_9HYPO|nr:unnamed protein product [Clonostachys rhizophaga]
MVVVTPLGVALSLLFSVVTSRAASSPGNGHGVTRAVLEDEAYGNSLYKRSFGGFDERDLEDLAERDDEVPYARQKPSSRIVDSPPPIRKRPKSQRKPRRPRGIRLAEPEPKDLPPPLPNLGGSKKKSKRPRAKPSLPKKKPGSSTPWRNFKPGSLPGLPGGATPWRNFKPGMSLSHVGKPKRKNK